MMILGIWGCQSENEDKYSDLFAEKIYIKLNYDESTFDNNTRAGFQEITEVHYLLSDEEGNILSNFMSAYNQLDHSIVIEPLPRGNYQLCVLAYTSSIKDKGLIINKNLTHISQQWFQLDDQEVFTSFDEYICFGKLNLEISNQPIINYHLTLSHVLTSLKLDVDAVNQYLEASIVDMNLSIHQPAAFYNGMNVSGDYCGDSYWNDQLISVKDRSHMMMMPAVSTEKIDLKLALHTSNHNAVEYVTNYQFSTLLIGGTQHIVNVRFANHPDANTATLRINPSLDRKSVV